jgi:hypothetical protein
MPGRARALGADCRVGRPARSIRPWHSVDFLTPAPIRVSALVAGPWSVGCSVSEAASDAVLGAAPTRHWRANGRPTPRERHFLEVATIGGRNHVSQIPVQL